MMRFTVGRRSRAWRIWSGLNDTELACAALMICGVLVVAMFMGP
jgi:hypothetical protein